MLLTLSDITDAATTSALAKVVAGLAFADGAATAGRFARTVKANDQATASPARDAIVQKVQTALMANDIFNIAARPRHMTPLVVSRYRQGQTYGRHVDDALMQGLRTDISFTLFLSDPATYEGGDLVIEDTLETRAIKLPAGSLILYPSTTLHHVAPVTSGTRLAVVGWVQSWIRDAGQREILFDLERSLRQVFDTEGKSELFDLLSKSRSNLLRMWADH